MNRRKMLEYAGISVAGVLGAAYASEGAEPAMQGGALNAVWVHGTAVEVEDPGALNAVHRVGWGTLFKGKPGKSTWVHISFPTPVIINDVRPVLEKVFVFYQTNGATIRSVHIYDGVRKIKSFDGLRLDGDHIGRIDPANTWALSPPIALAFGLGISINVQFSIGFDSVVPTEILFSTAGADFRLRRPVGVRDSIELTPPNRRLIPNP